MGSYEVVYEPSAVVFIIRILGDTTEQDVVACFRQYEATVEMHFRHMDFNVVLTVDEAAHRSVAVLRLIRQSLENQTHRDHLAVIVGVSDDASKVAMSRSHGGDIPLFSDEGQAVDYLTRQARKGGVAWPPHSGGL
jgi:hypothetical protein